MDDLKHPYYTLMKIFLSTSGLWPYDSVWLSYVKKTFWMTICSIYMVFLIILCFRKYDECQRSILLNTVTCSIIGSVFLLKYGIFWYKADNIKKVIETIRYDWRALANKDEQRILLKIANRGRILSLIFTVLIHLSLGCFFYLMATKSPDIDICESSKKLNFPLDHITDDRRYIYILSLQTSMFYIFGALTILGTELFTILSSYHVVGLFQVVCYRLRCTFSDKILNAPSTMKTRAIREKLIETVEMHKRALTMCTRLSDTLAFSYLVLMLLGVANISISFLHLSEISLNEYKIVLLQLSMIASSFAYSFVTNHSCQMIMDYSSNLFFEAFNTRWYVAPVPVQKMLLFFMHHSLKAYSFRLGGLFIPNYEGFSTLARMSFSYFMVIRSTQS